MKGEVTRLTMGHGARTTDHNYLRPEIKSTETRNGETETCESPWSEGLLWILLFLGLVPSSEVTTMVIDGSSPSSPVIYFQSHHFHQISFIYLDTTLFQKGNRSPQHDASIHLVFSIRLPAGYLSIACLLQACFSGHPPTLSWPNHFNRLSVALPDTFCQSPASIVHMRSHPLYLSQSCNQTGCPQIILVALNSSRLPTFTNAV